MKEINKLLLIQSELKAPKDLVNKFANYNYRSCESILEALKPLLLKHGCLLTLTDEVLAIGNRIYVKASAGLCDVGSNASWIVTAFAREEEVKKGMDSSQITGAASSYARKYALNGLFLIDDNKDSDHTNDGTEAPKQAVNSPKTASHPTPATMSPSGPNPVKSVIGTIEAHSENGEWHKYTIKDVEISTKNPMDIEAMSAYHEDNSTIAVEYSEVVKGRFTNRYLKSISLVEDVKF